jgi:hypothetical protein
LTALCKFGVAVNWSYLFSAVGRRGKRRNFEPMTRYQSISDISFSTGTHEKDDTAAGALPGFELTYGPIPRQTSYF